VPAGIKSGRKATSIKARRRDKKASLGRRTGDSSARDLARAQADRLVLDGKESRRSAREGPGKTPGGREKYLEALDSAG